MSNALYIVGDNIQAWKAARDLERGMLSKIAKGVYVRPSVPEVDRPALIKNHALRILAKLYPTATLVGRSAYLRGVDESGRIALMRAAASTGSDPLEGIDVDLLRGDAESGVTEQEMHDDIGPYTVRVASPERIVSEDLRGRHGSLDRLKDSELLDLLTKSGYEGDIQAYIQKHNASLQSQGLWAAENYSLDASDEKTLKRRLAGAYNEPNQTGNVWNVHWYGREIGLLRHNDPLFHFQYHKGWILPLGNASQQNPQELPLFIQNSLMEVESERDSRQILRLNDTRRAIGHISFSKPGDPTSKPYLDPETLAGDLADFTDSRGYFSNAAAIRTLFEKSGIHEISSQAANNKQLTRLSGLQTKLQTHLDLKGELGLAFEDVPMTHILKISSSSSLNNQVLGYKEYMGRMCAAAVGLRVPPAALVNLVDPDCPSYLVQRFDIWGRDDADRRLIYLEDVCSMLGLPSFVKYKGSAESVIDLIKKNSTSSKEDLKDFFIQLFAADIISAGDFHLKNLSFIKKADPSHSRWEEQRLSPVYDWFSTANMEGIRQSVPMKIGEWTETLTSDSFEWLGKYIGWTKSQTQEVMFQTVDGLVNYWKQASQWLPHVKNPRVLEVLTGDLDYLQSKLHLVADNHPALRDLPQIESSKDWAQLLSSAAPK